jgi:hypothetical protein
MSDKPVKGSESISDNKVDLTIGDKVESVSIGGLEANFNDSIEGMWKSHRDMMEEWDRLHEKRAKQAQIFHKKAADRLADLLEDTGIDIAEEDLGDYGAFFGNMANFSEVEEAEGFADLLFTAISGAYDKINASDLAKFMYPDHKVSSDGFIYVKK